jgi:hypothetical protein
MMQRKISQKKLQQIRELAAEWGKIVARHAGNPADAQLDFSDLEHIAAAAAAGLTQGTLTVLLQQYGQSLPDQSPCPDCQRPCPVTYEPRSLTVAGGLDLPLHEPICHCPDCRRDFFPPPHPPASGQS